MRERGVSTASVRLALSKPLLRRPSYPPTEIVQFRDKKGTLEIVFTQERSKYIIITAYYK